MRKKTVSPFASALIIADVEGVAAIDRSALHSQGIRHVRILSSGEEAARLLAKQTADETARNDIPPFDLVICNATLADMRGADFIGIIRKHPKLAALPVVLASANATRADVLAGIKAGCSGFLLRPYTTTAFEEQLFLAAKALTGSYFENRMRKGQQALETSDFDKALEELHAVADVARPRAEVLYEAGMDKLAAGDYNGAISAFNKAVRLNVLYAEAYLGLARAWRGKGDSRQAQKYLRMAAEAYARLEQFAESRSVFQQLAKERPDVPNPLTGTANFLLKQGNYTAAARAFAESHRLEPQADLTTQISRACHFTDKPEATAKALYLALEHLGEKDIAERIHRRILSDPSPRDAHPSSALLSRFPRLTEMLSVARYTIRLYRETKLADDAA
ncbi:response regulator [Desulfovibrio mangrovi]|uniref:tetratricopeptide repeat protein n=1 Tax=Desulfovibrio mangrovi TaxID=2976983 RepID=UPI0022463FC0|nr:response regulator [Desulfovibrio mangrovi]UZP68697.1 response regulator [Desulfovibrio mangrovi]